MSAVGSKPTGCDLAGALCFNPVRLRPRPARLHCGPCPAGGSRSWCGLALANHTRRVGLVHVPTVEGAGGRRSSHESDSPQSLAVERLGPGGYGRPRRKRGFVSTRHRGGPGALAGSRLGNDRDFLGVQAALSRCVSAIRPVCRNRVPFWTRIGITGACGSKFAPGLAQNLCGRSHSAHRRGEVFHGLDAS